MNNEKTEIQIKELDGDLIFQSNRIVEGDTVSYSLNDIKEIFEINPLPSTEIKDGDTTKTIRFYMEYDTDKNTFYVSMFIDKEKINSKELSLIDMLDILVDTYTKASYIVSHNKLKTRISDMLNTYSYTLIEEGKIPNMEIMLQGIGEITVDNKLVALFDRVMLNPKGDSVLLCEVVGDMPCSTKMKISIKTDIGVTIEVDDLYIEKQYDYAELMGIQYVEAYLSSDKLIDKIELFKNEKFTFKQEINTLFSHETMMGDIQSLIGFSIQCLNENSSESLIDFVRHKKDILFKEEEESYLLDQVDDLFEDLF